MVMPYSVGYVIARTAGCAGKFTAKKSSRLTYSIHSCAKESPERHRTNATVARGLTRMIYPPYHCHLVVIRATDLAVQTGTILHPLQRLRILCLPGGLAAFRICLALPPPDAVPRHFDER